jgi:NAD(P)-dependent dehydrogenase (short-subunit alcohol dehydrogenase family)
MPKLTNRVAIVTGAAVSVGREIAITFASESARAFVNYSKSLTEAEETAERVRQAGGEPLLCQADVAETAFYLATGADFMTGAVIVVDDGRALTQ